MAEPIKLEALRYRRPWYLLGVVLLVALLGTAWVGSAMRSRMADNTQQADFRQSARLNALKAAGDDFTSDAVQLLNAAGAGPCIAQIDERTMRSLLIGLLESRTNQRIYGLGCFFGPGAFMKGRQYFGPYVSHDARGTHYQTNSDGRYRYHSLAWYRAAIAVRGRAIPYGPYLDDGTVYFSFLKAFRLRGHLAGVASVDAPATTLVALSRGVLLPGDYAYTMRGNFRALTVGKPLPPNVPQADMRVPVAFTKSYIHLASDRRPLQALNARIFIDGLAAIVVLWIVAGLIVLVLMRSWKSTERTVALEIEQVALQNEIALREKVEAHLRTTAYVDVLSGLSNRAFVLDSVAALLREGRTARLFFIDLDSFSMINDTLGHESGDEFLCGLAKHLRDAFPRAIVARTGGDEFAVLDDRPAVTIAEGSRTLRQAFEHPVSVRGRPTHCTASFGIVEIDASYERAVDALRDAEIAMYHAKTATRGGGSLFNVVMRRELEREAELEGDLLRAIHEDEFEAYYQPIVDIKTRRITSLEALARWNRPNHGLQLPRAFIPFAETHGLVSAIDALVMKRACSQMPQLLTAAPTLSVAVNCSMAQLTGSELATFVHEQLRMYEIPPAHLRLEITETSVMRNAESALASLERLRALGVLAVVDDFGTGYSSLAYLQRLPIAGVKIDRSFITPLEESPQAKAIVRGVIALAETLGLYTVAEGVETPGQLAILEQLGANYVQGFFFSKPLGLNDMLAHLSAQALTTK